MLDKSESFCLYKASARSKMSRIKLIPGKLKSPKDIQINVNKCSIDVILLIIITNKKADCEGLLFFNESKEFYSRGV